MENKKKINKLFEYIYKYRFLYFCGAIMLVLVDGGQLYIPQYTGAIIDGLTDHTIGYGEATPIVLKIIFVSILIALGRGGFRYFIIGTSRKVERGIQNDMFRKLETLSQRYYNENKTGDLMAYFTNDLEAIREAIGWSVISAFDAIFLTIMCLYNMMVKISVTLTLYTIIPMICIGFYGYFIFSKFDEWFFKKQDSFAKLSDVVQESVTAERVIKAFVQEDKQLEYFKEVNAENRKINMGLAKLRSFAWPVLDLFVGCAFIIAIVAGGYYAIIGEITLGKFVTFSSYVGTLVWPMLAFGDTITMFSQAFAANKRISNVFMQRVEITDSPNPDPMTTLKGGISFENVSFKYANDLGNALENINVDIKPGETFAIMGRTGAGKSTMVNLITRLFDVTEGRILIDGVNIKDVKLNVLHENIAYVPQDNFLFSETLKNNIAFGKQQASMDEIIEACKMAEIHDNIMDFPEQYETMVGERGVTLSGGQKQRSSIARALLKDSPVLIMDDSLSAVDTDTEDNIIHNLKSLRKGKTTIMIAHRVSTVQSADHILVLEDGKMAEYGTYDQLMAMNGQFASMVTKQQLEKQLATEV